MYPVGGREGAGIYMSKTQSIARLLQWNPPGKKKLVYFSSDSLVNPSVTTFWCPKLLYSLKIYPLVRPLEMFGLYTIKTNEDW